MLICSVFAIPLAFFTIQLAQSYHLQAKQAQITKDGLIYIQKTSLLMQELETLRDLDVITSWKADSNFASLFEKSKNEALDHINKLISFTEDKNNQVFLEDLKYQVTSDEMAKGTESNSIDAVYDDAQLLLDSLHNWRAKLSYSFISFSKNNSHILSIINLFNETDTFTRTLGEARSYGSLYLTQQFIDSHGVEVIEHTYQHLSQLIELIDLKDSEYQPFFIAYPEANLSPIKEGLIAGREALYQQLIVAPSPISDPLEYFNSLSDSYHKIYSYSHFLFNLSTDIVESDYSNSIKQLWTFYLSALFIGLLLIYLVIGLYFSISVTIRELRRSAAYFSAGKYDKPVKIIAHDELTSVAEAMDIMRVNIKEREEKLALLSQTDGLTKLSNRKFFDQALRISLANSRRNLTPVSIVMMDIDFFKKVNDQYGHLAGDECLIKIAQLMKSHFKRQTDVVARYGGEEFIAILYGQELEEALQQTEKLRAQIENTLIQTSEGNFNVTASFGLTCLKPPIEAETQDLIALADALLYQSKDNGRNRVSSKYYSSDDSHELD